MQQWLLPVLLIIIAETAYNKTDDWHAGYSGRRWAEMMNRKFES